ncbi:hypothetical protein [Niveispirillum cyanobacteriorum]|uniref:Uncharacterized protein n=1 Tax=Niveispirillum cyanobacteriorum TaxID=1612173 RepID=A0A2K9NHF5_9PROT|nr:hypothetical protein [Niveispirillum cyanobacteriorum]AUN31996.1 hypothetical protein C0V82_16330 [Niveispirillum cyanobacteriorum]GGE85104.1 hypothetical protein GCM10011317_47880 [Niveispirillum cyanobacteriorum]
MKTDINTANIQKWATTLANTHRTMMVAEGRIIRGGPHPYFPVCGEVREDMPEADSMAKLWAGSMEMFRTLAAIRSVCRDAAGATPQEHQALLTMIIAQVSDALPVPTNAEQNAADAGTPLPEDSDPPAIYKDMAEMAAGFMLRWRADMRAIARWQAATGRVMTWPDHADLCVWLMEQLDAKDATSGARWKSPGAMPFLTLGPEPDGWDVDGAGGPGYSLLWKAIQVWAVCQGRVGVTIGEAAAVFNMPLSMVAQAITETNSPFMFLGGPADDPKTTIEHDGE